MTPVIHSRVSLAMSRTALGRPEPSGYDVSPQSAFNGGDGNDILIAIGSIDCSVITNSASTVVSTSLCWTTQPARHDVSLLVSRCREQEHRAVVMIQHVERVTNVDIDANNARNAYRHPPNVVVQLCGYLLAVFRRLREWVRSLDLSWVLLTGMFFAGITTALTAWLAHPAVSGVCTGVSGLVAFVLTKRHARSVEAAAAVREQDERWAAAVIVPQRRGCTGRFRSWRVPLGLPNWEFLRVALTAIGSSSREP
jgi:hypothetical protein